MSERRTQWRIAEVASIVEILNDHDHARAYPLPSLAAALTLTPGGIWTYGAKVEFAAAGVIVGGEFDFHWADVVASANAEYQFALYEGAVGFENIITEFTFERTGVLVQTTQLEIMCARQPSGTRISAAVATSSGAGSATLKLHYHMY